MKFKVVKGTETFDKLVAFRAHVNDVNKQAKDMVTQLGGARYCRKSNKLAGGLSAIEFETKPEGYKMAGEKWQHLYYPKASNKKDCALIEGLPTIDYDELNSIVNFKAPQTISAERGILWVSTVDLTFGDEEMLIGVRSGCEYEPPADVVEILESEYDKLKKKLNPDKE
jgi:hypothetical protein